MIKGFLQSWFNLDKEDSSQNWVSLSKGKESGAVSLSSEAQPCIITNSTSVVVGLSDSTDQELTLQQYLVRKSQTMSGFHTPKLAGMFQSSDKIADTGSTPNLTDIGIVNNHMDHSSFKWITPKKYNPTRNMRFKALGEINPALYMNDEAEDIYEMPAGHLGRLWFNINYETESETLTVKVRKARNLRVLKEVTSGQAGDCHLRVFLENDERRIHNTSVKKKTNNPNFDEVFRFQISAIDLTNQIIHFTVFHTDKQRRQKIIGHVRYPLKELKLFEKEVRLFRDIEKMPESTEQPELKLTLTHSSQFDKIIVGLNECRNLPTKSDGTPIDLYLRVSLHHGLQAKEIKSKRTECLGAHSFSESLIFNKVTDLNQSLIKVTMMQHCSHLGALFDKAIGYVQLGPELFCKRKELEHWQEMTENADQAITYWHTMSSVQ